jgi:DNA repair exonuclease SbcCD ATPase subunit
MNYQERVNTRADVRALYEKVLADPSISHYRGYTASKSYGWNAAADDYCKRDGEVWFENPAFCPDGIAQEEGELLDERLEENARCIEALHAERDDLCAMIDTLDARIAALEEELSSVSAERDEALAALATLREALQAIKKITESAAA